MLRVATAEVLEVHGEENGWQTLAIRHLGNGSIGKAFCYWRETGRCRPGEHVLINTTAEELGLGTGGYHFVIGRLEQAGEADLYPTSWGHIIKMRYAPLQLAVDAVEEQNSPHHALFVDDAQTLEGTPVLIGELHSLLPLLILALKQREPNRSLVYIMPDSAALPILVSRHVRTLRRLGLLQATVTTGQAWGGDLEAVNLHTGLLAAKWVAKGDLLLCFLGPGVVGTGTSLGFSGMQLAEVIHAVSLLGGIPIVVPRISFSDPRLRHRGMSHHTRTVLKRFTLRPVILPVPRFGDDRDALLEAQEGEDQLEGKHLRVVLDAPSLGELEPLQASYPLPLSTMGRTLAEDPSPFQAAFLAAEVALQVVRWGAPSSVWSPDLGAEAILAAFRSFWTCGEA